MLTTVEGIYKEGHIELLEKPEGIEEARLLVTFLDDKTAPKRNPQPIRFGQFAGGEETSEEDFKLAEWHGEPEFFDE